MNDVVVGSALTDTNGLATLNGVNLSGFGAGAYPGAIQASFGGDVLYGRAARASADLSVARATPPVYWSNPAPIVEGTPLDSTQLNAYFYVPGVLTYSAAGWHRAPGR